jgi:hypothetical protein
MLVILGVLMTIHHKTPCNRTFFRRMYKVIGWSFIPVKYTWKRDPIRFLKLRLSLSIRGVVFSISHLKFVLLFQILGSHIRITVKLDFVHWRLIKLRELRNKQYSETNVMHFYSVYSGLKASACFEHYLLILRIRCTEDRWYIAGVLCHSNPCAANWHNTHAIYQVTFV